MGKEKRGGYLNNFDWRDFLDKFHVYGGLFIAFYLIMLGISSLQMQHHFYTPKGGAKKLWQREINMPEIEDNQKYKLAVRDSLGLYGNAPYWEDYKDDKGVHHFMITRPGKQYWVEVPTSGNVFKIEEARTGFINPFMALHGLTSGWKDGPGFVKIWRFFGQIMNIVFLIIIIITIYFWYERSFATYKGWIFAGGFVLSTIIILAFIWLIG